MIRVGSRILVSSYTDPVVAPHDVHVLIHPSSAFGDGAHPTTQMCLAMLEDEITGGEAVLDLGTGSGILAIAAAKLGAGKVTAADIVREACEAAVANVRLNRMGQAVRVFQGSVEAIHARTAFDVVVTNLYNAHQIQSVLPALARRVRARGRIICSGIWQRRGDAVMRLLADDDFTFRNQVTVDNLTTIVAVKNPS